jgi:hypothetical protein
MEFNSNNYINTLLDNFAKNYAYYSYLKLKKCKKSDKYFAPDTHYLVTDGYEVYGILNTNKEKGDRKVTWNNNLCTIHNY